MQLLLFFFPILFETFFQQLYNAADAVIVGRFVGKSSVGGGGGGTLIPAAGGIFRVDCPAVPRSLFPSIMGQNAPRW